MRRLRRNKTGFGRSAAARVLAVAVAALLLCGCQMRAGRFAEFVPAEKDRLTLYTSHKPEVYEPIVREFEERTGLWVTVVSGGTNELLERIETDPASADADLMFGGGLESLLVAADLFAPYTGAEADNISEVYQSGDERIVSFSALPIVLIYNTKLVEPEQVTGWASLLDPLWRGQIAFADPNVSGSSFTALCTLCQIMGGDASETMRLFAENLNGEQLSGSGEVLTAVADGILPIGVTLEETALKYVHAGYDIGLVYPAEGTSAVPDGCAILSNAPHRENAEKFIDFILGQDVQQMLIETMYRHAVRENVPKSAALPAVDAIAYDYAWSISQHDVLLDAWNALTEVDP